MGLRSSLLRSIKRYQRRNRPSIIVASMGRSGSTVIFEALQARTDARPAESFLIDIAGTSFEPGAIYKTHDYPDALRGARNVRAVFLFGGASEAAKSVYFQEKAKGREWIGRHFKHLKVHQPFEKLFEADILRIGDQLDVWTTWTHTPVLSLHYDTMWDNIDILRQFTGLNVQLPERRPRRDKSLPADLEEKCLATYGELDGRIAAMPDIILSGPKVL